MKIEAIHKPTGKVLLSNQGGIPDASFRKTVSSLFPNLDPSEIEIVTSHARSVLGPKRDPKPVVQKSVVWKGSFCFPSDAKVLTLNGAKEIKDIEVGDMVFTHLGRPRMVVRKYERVIREELLSVSNALDGEELVLTPGHNVFAIKGEGCVLRKSQTCKPSCHTQYNLQTAGSGNKFPRCKRKPYLTYSLQKVQAGELTLNDFLIHPRLTSYPGPAEIDVSQNLGAYKNWSTDGEWIWPSRSHNATNKATIARSIGVKESWVWKGLRISESNKKTVDEACALAILDGPEFDEKAEVNRIPLKHKLTPDFARFLGLYVAEGSSPNCYSVAFAFHSKEHEFHDFVMAFIESEFGLKATKADVKGKNAVSIVVSSSLLGHFMDELCGKWSENKRIPSFVFSASDEVVTGFINGLWDGDGNKNARKKDNSIKYASMSPSLIYGLRLLLSRFGVSTSIHQERNGAYVLTVSGEQLYTNEWLKSFRYNQVPTPKTHPRTRSNYVSAEGTMVKITSLERRAYEGLVYDLEVEEDHSYIVNGRAVKNSDLGGYANMNREICLRLPFHGFRVKVEVLPTGPQVDQMTRALIRAFETTKIENEQEVPIVVGFTPMQIMGRGRRVIFYTMMETQGLHKDFVQRCNESATEIWVPCKFYAEVFAREGVIRPISVLPLGVNQNIYVPTARESPLNYEEFPTGDRWRKAPDAFRFISLFGWSYRKGTDVLIRSYLNEFSSQDDVALVIYSRYMGSSAEQQKEYVRREIGDYFRECPKKNPPHVFWCGDEIPIEQLPGCYASANCFVFCSRGEGFGLPVIEAGACGIPVISALHTSMTEYLDEEVSYPIAPAQYGPANDKLTWISGYYRDQNFAILGEEETKKFGLAMRHVYEHREEAEAKAAKFRARILENYTWDICARRVAEHLGG